MDNDIFHLHVAYFVGLNHYAESIVSLHPWYDYISPVCKNLLLISFGSISQLQHEGFIFVRHILFYVLTRDRWYMAFYKLRTVDKCSCAVPDISFVTNV